MTDHRKCPACQKDLTTGMIRHCQADTRTKPCGWVTHTCGWIIDLNTNRSMPVNYQAR